MKNETYLMINGQKIELTAEQKKQLGIIEQKSCFDKVENKEYYYAITVYGDVIPWRDINSWIDKKNYNIANYCTDKNLMYQRAMHETLNRLLWRYSMTHDGDKIDWKNQEMKYIVAYDYIDKEFYIIQHSFCRHMGVIYFNTEEIAKAAIEEIIKPFMKEHPDFVW